MCVLAARRALLFYVGNLAVRGHFTVAAGNAAAAERREAEKSNETHHGDPPPDVEQFLYRTAGVRPRDDVIICALASREKAAVFVTDDSEGAALRPQDSARVPKTPRRLNRTPTNWIQGSGASQSGTRDPACAMRHRARETASRPRRSQVTSAHTALSTRPDEVHRVNSRVRAHAFRIDAAGVLHRMFRIQHRPRTPRSRIRIAQAGFRERRSRIPNPRISGPHPRCADVADPESRIPTPADLGSRIRQRRGSRIPHP